MSDENNQNKEEQISEAELDKIISDIQKEESGKVEQFPLLKSTKKESSTQALTLELTGSIQLKLSFKGGGRSIELLCTDDALICRMADGTEFKIPTNVGELTTRKSA